MKYSTKEAGNGRVKSSTFQRARAIGTTVGEVTLTSNDLAVDQASGQMVPLNYVSKPR